MTSNTSEGHCYNQFIYRESSKEIGLLYIMEYNRISKTIFKDSRVSIPCPKVFNYFCDIKSDIKFRSNENNKTSIYTSVFYAIYKLSLIKAIMLFIILLTR